MVLVFSCLLIIDLVTSGKVRYIGASSMFAYQFLGYQHVAETNGWTKFISMQNQYSLLYREEEREMIPACKDQGVGYFLLSHSDLIADAFPGGHLQVVSLLEACNPTTQNDLATFLSKVC